MPGLQLDVIPQDIYNAINKCGLISNSTPELSLLIPFLYNRQIINLQVTNKSCRFKYKCLYITDSRIRTCVEQFAEVCIGNCQ
jgi:hypothetical protein